MHAYLRGETPTILGIQMDTRLWRAPKCLIQRHLSEIKDTLGVVLTWIAHICWTPGAFSWGKPCGHAETNRCHAGAGSPSLLLSFESLHRKKFTVSRHGKTHELETWNVQIRFSMENDLTWVPEKDMAQAFYSLSLCACEQRPQWWSDVSSLSSRERLQYAIGKKPEELHTTSMNPEMNWAISYPPQALPIAHLSRSLEWCGLWSSLRSQRLHRPWRLITVDLANGQFLITATWPTYWNIET